MTQDTNTTLAGIEAAVAEAAEAITSGVEAQMAHQQLIATLIAAIRALKAPVVNFTSPEPAVTLNVPSSPPPNVTVEAAKSWDTISVTPRRNTFSGDVESYTIKRVK